MSLKKTIVALLLLIVPLAGAYWLVWSADRDVPAPRGARERAPVAVETAVVERGTVRERRTLTGTLTSASRFEVATKVAGRLEELLADLGDVVERGQAIARLDDDELRLDVDQARAELEVARANLGEAQSAVATRQRELGRVQRLREQRVVAEAELDAARAELETQQARARVATAQVRQREAALAAAEIRLAQTTVRVSWQGPGDRRVVAERLADEGSLLSANTPILTVVDLGRLVAVSHVAERDYPRLSVGQAVEVAADAVPGRPFEGRIARLAPVVREASRQARVEIEIENPEMILKPGMFVRARIELDRADDAIVVPSQAIIERDGTQGVFIVDEAASVARFVPVRVGIVEGPRTQLLDTPPEGPVVTLGHHLLSDGAPILAPDVARPADTVRRGTP